LIIFDFVLYQHKKHVCLNYLFSFRIDHLIEGHNYNFRVKAVNKIGESLPLTTFDSITAKDPYGKPDKPGTPQATGKTRNILFTILI